MSCFVCVVYRERRKQLTEWDGGFQGERSGVERGKRGASNEGKQVYLTILQQHRRPSTSTSYHRIYIYIVGRPGLLVVSPSVGHSHSHISVTKITPRCGCQIVLLVPRKTVSPDTSIQTLVYNIPLDDLIIHLYHHHHHHHPLLTSGLDGVTHTRSSPLTLDPRPSTPT